MLKERFPNLQMNIIIVYKYLASKHLPNIVLLSTELPYSIVVKKLSPEGAWREYYFSHIIKEFEHFDFAVQYHQELGYISERYLPGFDVIELPDEFISDPEYIEKIFYWLGKCAYIGYVFGIGDRGHNERFFYNNTIPSKKYLFYTKDAEPIINIDFEDFPSRRFYFPYIDATEIALLFYVVYLQLSNQQKQNWKKYFQIFESGLQDKYYSFKNEWVEKKSITKQLLFKLQEKIAIRNTKYIFKLINNRATNGLNSDCIDLVFEIIENDIQKNRRRLP